MAKPKEKAKSADYNPEVLLDEAHGATDMEVAKKYYKTVANMPQGNTSYRQNIAYRGQEIDKYGNLENRYLNPKDSMRLAKVVYDQFGMVRHALDTMSEFTVSSIDFLSKKKASRDAMLGWSEAIGLKGFLDALALEYYRSGNCYIYRFESKIKDSAFTQLSSAFGIASTALVPTRYTLLDPLLVDFVSGGFLDNRLYQVTIPGSEITTAIQWYKSHPEKLVGLPVEFSDAIKQYLGKSKGKTGDLIITLNPDNLIVLYRKKQPYERYATPFLTGTYNDLEFKEELRAMDKAVARNIARMLVHVAVGDAEHIPSPAALDAIRQKLANASTSTYLITDGSVKINQYYPNIGEMMDPKKYDAVAKDIMIALGITPAAYGDGAGSFSNNFLGIKVLIERVKDGRTKIQEEFLVPECERVARAFKLKSTPQPQINGVDLNDEKEFAKIYTRLYEDGVFSPQSVIESIRDQRVPTYDEEVDRQVESLALRKAGLFQPNLNRGGDSNNSGKPEGTTSPDQTSPVSKGPVGATVLRAFTELEYNEAIDVAQIYLKSKLNLKKLSKDQKGLIEEASKEYLLQSELQADEYHKFLDNLIKK